MGAPEVTKIGRDHYAVVNHESRIWSVAKLPARQGGRWVVIDPRDQQWPETFPTKDEAIAAVTEQVKP